MSTPPPGRPAPTFFGPPAASFPREMSSIGGIPPPAAECERESPMIHSGSPYATARYVAVTGDSAILDETIPYLLGPCLEPNQNDDYGLPAESPDSQSLYDHCAPRPRLGPAARHPWPATHGPRRLERRYEPRWPGKGESVWLAWFQIACLRRFSQLSEIRGDADRTARWRQYADRLHAAIEQTAWDESWYLRAFFDDGTPLGSAQNDACMIDSIAQTWGVLSGGRRRGTNSRGHEVGG